MQIGSIERSTVVLTGFPVTIAVDTGLNVAPRLEREQVPCQKTYRVGAKFPRMTDPWLTRWTEQAQRSEGHRG
jgi:hypothetical protein